MTVLEEQVATARRQIVSDGYDMSVGEVMSLYRQNELVINPSYQRLFRWNDSQKTRFIESLLLGIPIPPIFVFQKADGVWELIDGLQRVSTILEFAGLLKNEDGTARTPSVLSGTNLLPALEGVYWEPKFELDPEALTIAQQLTLKRARLRVEILKQETDEDAKFELFQRLNTGGSTLSPQEVRNCVLVMVRPEYYEWLKIRAESPAFTATLPLTESAKSEQRYMELALRFIAYRRVPYGSGLDVNEYLDKAAQLLAKSFGDSQVDEEATFETTFLILSTTLGADAFRRWDGTRHSGPFLISGFDAIAHGVATNIGAIRELANRDDWLRDRVRSVWSQKLFLQNSGMGVRGTTRLTNLLPFGVAFFKP